MNNLQQQISINSRAKHVQRERVVAQLRALAQNHQRRQAVQAKPVQKSVMYAIAQDTNARKIARRGMGINALLQIWHNNQRQATNALMQAIANEKTGRG